MRTWPRIILAIVLLFAAPSCAIWSRGDDPRGKALRAKVDEHVTKPLDAFHDAYGRYPDSLEALKPDLSWLLSGEDLYYDLTGEDYMLTLDYTPSWPQLGRTSCIRGGTTLEWYCFSYSAYETNYGVTREADLKAVPELSCISLALRSVPAIDHVEESHGSAYGEDLHTWSYDASDGLSAWLAIRVTGKHVTFQQMYMFVDRKIPSKELMRARRLMLDIEKRLESRCIAGLSSRIVEECENVDCPPLD